MNMKENKFKKTESSLYNYNSLDTKIKNIEIDIENLENDITVRAISFVEKSSPTHKITSSVEDEVIRREEYIQEQICILKAKKKYYSDLKIKIQSSLQQLSENEYKLVKLRYLSGRNKKSWIEIGQELGFDKDYCKKIRTGVINYLSELIYP